MNLTQDRVRSIGWAFVLTVCFAVTMAITMRVNAVKSQVRLAERQIVRLKQQTLMLETELETRGNQQQLKTINDTEFGYMAPSAKQYIKGERQLAALAKPRAVGAPSPVRVAVALGEVPTPLLTAMVSPLTGKSSVVEPSRDGDKRVTNTADLADRLSLVQSSVVAVR